MGFQSGNINNTSIGLKNSDIDKITKALLDKLGPLIGGSCSKTVYIQGKPGETVNEDYTPESMERLAKVMILQQSEKIINFSKLGTTKEIQKDKKETDKTLDLLKKLE